MIEWWNSLQLAQQIFYCIAIPSTLVILIQTILLMLGMGDAGEGVDISDTGGLDGADIGDISDVADGCSHTEITDGGNPADYGTLQMFTIQGIMTFLCVFSWSGVICLSLQLHLALTIIISIAAGALAMFGVAKLLQLTSRLAQNGNINMKNLLGEKGSVYIPIPPAQSGQGKVTVTTEERCVEFSAVTDDETAIPTGAQVRITDVRGELLVVEIDN